MDMTAGNSDRVTVKTINTDIAWTQICLKIIQYGGETSRTFTFTEAFTAIGWRERKRERERERERGGERKREREREREIERGREREKERAYTFNQMSSGITYQILVWLFGFLHLSSQDGGGQRATRRREAIECGVVDHIIGQGTEDSYFIFESQEHHTSIMLKGRE